jgi:23S rRNA (guanosine2251-2'-O)-methyltransferase
MSQSRREFPQRREKAEKSDEMMIYGLRPVMEALGAGKEFDRIFIGRGAKGELMQELKTALKEKGLAWQEVPIETLHRYTRQNHQEIVAFISAINYHSVEQIVPFLFEKGLTPLILVLDRITDVRNFGAIARTAECAGVHAIVIPSRNAAQVTPDAIRTSAGALSRIPVCRSNHLKDAIYYLQQSGLQVFAATEKGKDFHYTADFNQPCAIVMGSEEDGVSVDLIRICDRLLKIPVFGSVASLNVSVAAGVLIYEAIRQRSKV